MHVIGCYYAAPPGVQQVPARRFTEGVFKRVPQHRFHRSAQNGSEVGAGMAHEQPVCPRRQQGAVWLDRAWDMDRLAAAVREV